MKALNPTRIAAPFGAYSHGILGTGADGIIVTSGQLGLAADGTIPEGVGPQADLCFDNISAILAEAGASAEHVIRLNAYVTSRDAFADYMAARDRWLGHVPVLPASTLVIVTGFTRPEFLVEVEATAIVPRSNTLKL